MFARHAIRWQVPFLAVGMLMSACTYGPEEMRSTIGQIVRIADSPEALVVVAFERFRPPVGLSAFPDGGKARVLERWARLYLIDASQRTAVLLTEQAPADSLWESFSLSLRGLEGDSAAYVQMTGCPRRGQCYPGVSRSVGLRITRRGQVTSVPETPTGVGLPGVMPARAPGEAHYVRFGRKAGFITARFVDGGPWLPIFELGERGDLVAVGG